jgi:hypothetical protein
MVFQATQNAPTELEELSVERDVEADGYVVGFEDAGGSFIEVGRLENFTDDVTQPLEIKHANSGERIALDSTGLETNGDVRPGRNLILEEKAVRTPNSVVHQYRGQNFTDSVWADSVGEADIILNGPQNAVLDGSESVKSGKSDGVDDFGITSTNSPSNPSDLPENESFGVAFTFQSQDKTNKSAWFGCESQTSDVFFRVIDVDALDGSNGELLFNLNDGTDSLNVETTDSFADGQVHLVCINKKSNNPSDVNIYVDDMTTPVSVNASGQFDNTSYSLNRDMTFFANNRTSVDQFKSFFAGLFEFNEDIYDSVDRQNLKTRRPEV